MDSVLFSEGATSPIRKCFVNIAYEESIFELFENRSNVRNSRACSEFDKGFILLSFIVFVGCLRTSFDVLHTPTNTGVKRRMGRFVCIFIWYLHTRQRFVSILQQPTLAGMCFVCIFTLYPCAWQHFVCIFIVAHVHPGGPPGPQEGTLGPSGHLDGYSKRFACIFMCFKYTNWFTRLDQ